MSEQMGTPYAFVRGCEEGEVNRAFTGDVNARSDSTTSNTGHTPLTMSAARGFGDSCATLVREMGADVNAVGRNGWPPVWWAVHGNHEETVRLLLEELGAELNLKQGKAMGPLACSQGMGMDAYLVGRGAHPNSDPAPVWMIKRMEWNTERTLHLCGCGWEGGVEVDIGRLRQDGDYAGNFHHR